MSNMKHTYKSHAATPAQFQADMVEWLKLQATDYRARARGLTRTKKAMKEYTDKAEAYEFAANFIQAIVIEPESLMAANDAPSNDESCKNDCLRLLINNNKWIEAIRLYRQKTGSTLKNARAIIDSWRDMLMLSEDGIKEHCRTVAKDQKIMAIRDYRFWNQYNGRVIGLKEGLDFVNSLV